MTPTTAPLAVFTAPDAVTAAAGKPFDLRLGVKVEKVDKEKRIVRGVATAEVLDAHGQIVDYEAVKAAFATWKGNIREMHQPKAVGRGVDVECDDVAKRIYLSAYVSKGAPDTWEKVLDETLSEYSIGARATVKAEKAGDKLIERLFVTRLNEVSLVDAGACPGCEFEVVKMDGEMPVIAQDLTKDGSDPADPPAQAGDKSGDEPAAGDAATEQPAEKSATATVRLATSADVIKLLGMTKAERIQKAAELVLDVEVQKRMESYDIRTALSAISCLQDLVSSEWWDAKYAEQEGRAPDPEGPAQIEMLRNATELVLAYLISEFMSQFDEAGTAGALKVVDGVRTAESQARVLSVAPQLGALLEKIGRQPHAPATVAAAPAAELGEPKVEKAADPATVPTGGASAQSDAPSPSAATATPAASDESTATITKLEGQVSETTKALTQAQETIRAQAESISALQTRLEKIEAQPMPGGPVTRAMGTPVSKTIGQEGADAIDGADPAEVIKVLTDLASDPATTPAERERIAQKLLSYQMKTGAGRMVIQRPGV